MFEQWQLDAAVVGDKADSEGAEGHAWWPHSYGKENARIV